MSKNPREYNIDTLSAKFAAISRQVFPALLPRVSAGYCQRLQADESGVIITQMWNHNTSVMVAMLGTPCALPLRNSSVVLMLRKVIMCNASIFTLI
jgi:hypothetical protein